MECGGQKIKRNRHCGCAATQSKIETSDGGDGIESNVYYNGRSIWNNIIFGKFDSISTSHGTHAFFELNSSKVYIFCSFHFHQKAEKEMSCPLKFADSCCC